MAVPETPTTNVREDAIHTPTSTSPLSSIPVFDEKLDTPAEPPPPQKDGGTRAWLQVFGSFLLFLNVWGFSFAFGSFQNYYELEYLPDETSSAISWIGTLQGFLLLAVGIVSGPLFDLGYIKTMLFVGSFAGVFGMMMLSISTKYYQILLCQGICMGLGSGLLFVPSLALAARNFQKYRALAMAIMSCGAPVGGIVYTLVFERLIVPLGFAWTARTMAFIQLAFFVGAAPMLLWGVNNTGNINSGTPRRIIDTKAFSDLPFCLYTSSNFFVFWGYMVPFFFMPTFAQLELGMSRSAALYALMVAQAASILGRILSAAFAKRCGAMISWITCASCSAIFCLGWIGVRTQASFIAMGALYGLLSGGLIPLPPTVFPYVCPDSSVLGARLGMAQGIGSIATLTGAPIAAAISQMGASHLHRNYLGLQLFAGLVMMLGACNLMGLWYILVKRRNIKVFF